MILRQLILYPVVVSSVDLKLRSQVFSIPKASGGPEGKNIAGAEFSQALEQEDWIRTELQGKETNCQMSYLRALERKSLHLWERR